MLRDGFFRVAAVTPKIRVADCAHNAGSILRAAEEAAEKGANAAVFPELCLTGYTCGDLFLTETLLQGAENALQKLIRDTADARMFSAAESFWGCLLKATFPITANFMKRGIFPLLPVKA